VLTGVTRETLPTIVPDGDNLSSNVLHRTGGTKSKSKYCENNTLLNVVKQLALLHW